MYLWDILTPIIYLVFIVNLFYSYKTYRNKSTLPFTITILINAFIGFLTLWSIGMYLFIISALQLVGLLIILLKNKKSII
ncbi:hypothetical protein SAMN05216243_2316 [Sediminibacillus albus]|uniref:Uncharacterized protein n=1 Tax=Sediminibacillus albus TaxID=407036 RepID=A0A1G8ZZJ4_9BACI|nr:hypothetical protein SAMN05216243_2316 [Sediminibacillus albus]